MSKVILNEPIDAIENKINKLSTVLLKILLRDNTTKKNLSWATSTYEKHGFLYSPERQILPEQIIRGDINILTPRVSKSLTEQHERTKEKGEVFTPAWMCNEMNNYLDEDWFGRKDVFNVENDNGWIVNNEKIKFSKEKNKQWQDYVTDLRMEITCGEAPYLVNRYDVVHGTLMPIEKRIGIIDRKLRVINENVDDENEWIEWVEKAYKSTYGYDYQGDNVLIARENLLYTLVDYMIHKFNRQPDLKVLKTFASIISWNIWQMDGLDYSIPYTEVEVVNPQTSLFSFDDEEKTTSKIKAKIKNWNINKIIDFSNVKGEESMKFDYIVGNPPYHESKGGTKNVDIWPDFLFSALDISKHTVLIHPGRWVVPKKQMKRIHDNILSSGLKFFNYYPDSSKIFPNIVIDGGVTITCFEKNYNGQVKYYNEKRYLGMYDDKKIFTINVYEEEIVNKLETLYSEKKTMKDRVIGNIGSLGGGEFGYNKSQHINLLRAKPDGMKNPIEIWANKNYGKGSRFGWYYIEASELNSTPEILFTSRKVMIDKKGHAIKKGKANIINNIPVIVDKKSTASGDVLFVFPEKDEDYDLELIKSLFMTKTARFLMSIIQKDLYVRGFELIPDYTLFKKMLDGKLFTDDFFYKKFKFSEELITHIEKCISSKE